MLTKLILTLNKIQVGQIKVKKLRIKKSFKPLFKLTITINQSFIKLQWKEKIHSWPNGSTTSEIDWICHPLSQMLEASSKAWSIGSFLTKSTLTSWDLQSMSWSQCSVTSCASMITGHHSTPTTSIPPLSSGKPCTVCSRTRSTTRSSCSPRFRKLLTKKLMSWLDKLASRNMRTFRNKNPWLLSHQWQRMTQNNFLKRVPRHLSHSRNALLSLTLQMNSRNRLTPHQSFLERPAGAPRPSPLMALPMKRPPKLIPRSVVKSSYSVSITSSTAWLRCTRKPSHTTREEEMPNGQKRISSNPSIWLRSSNSWMMTKNETFTISLLLMINYLLCLWVEATL